MSLVTCRTMGCGGRFGNQLFAYAFAKGYCQKYGHTLLIPSSSILRYIFEIPEDVSDNTHFRNTPLDKIPEGEGEIDLYGYYQFQEAVDFWKNDFQTWFNLKPQWQSILSRKMGEYNEMTVCHLRGGDYLNLTDNFCYVTPMSYWKAIQTFDLTKQKTKWVSEYSTEIDPDVPGTIDFLPDFLTLVSARTLFRSNSTFAWWAATLRAAWGIDPAQKVYSPLVVGKFGSNLCEFTPGNHPQMASKNEPNLSDLYV